MPRRTADHRRRRDRHRRTIAATGRPPARRSGAGWSRLLVHRAGRAPDALAHLPAERAGRGYAAPRRDARFGHHGISPPARTAHTRSGGIVASAGPLLDGVRWAERSNVWVGARPIAADGRPVIGAVSPRVFVAGGHGMWGLAHGPVTGRLLAEQITTGKQPQALREFDPLRGRGR
ncbi:NAD(P)/FAD-dependent oxidoreductase [Mycobacterium pseudokansasii]|uniref:NAD(P)/FAD-dependent oxidoreductase n=1 Tax=Mycobacterium pseudokansasii TaxID=2341080 RepID=UPI003C6DA63E